ncbi:MAG: adenylosuccinate synthase [Cyclobacteriaceae bacterium]|nr:adenylosuccinate synthase [Cyclobacteriaceae bacterium]
MKVDVLLGLQWGDEGKGKIVDFLAPQYDVVARFQGGPNAGHTLSFDGIKHVLHQIPSGIFRNDIKNIIGNGVVLDAVIFSKEVEALYKYNLKPRENLYISKKAQLILPTHRLLDAAWEQSKGTEKIGSTLKGIGPAYQDKVARIGLRVGDILKENFRGKYDFLVAKHEAILRSLKFDYDLKELNREYFEAIDFLKTFNLINGEYFIKNELEAGRKIIAEGAQGSLLDIDFGSYPFVTSSNTTAAGAATGLGIAPSTIGDVFGIFKAYCTRVGSGPFPTELLNETGEKIREKGHEYGATTGRPRRCGWLDLPALKYAIMINGVTRLFMMKADVLTCLDKIYVCEKYKLEDGTTTEELPFELNDIRIEPVLREFKSWKNLDFTSNVYNDLPAELRIYIDYLENQLRVPIEIISMGPDRKNTILRNKMLAPQI